MEEAFLEAAAEEALFPLLAGELPVAAREKAMAEEMAFLQSASAAGLPVPLSAVL